MYRKLIILLVTVLFPVAILSQGVESFRHYDSLTFNQYLQSDWGNLRKSAREAINNGYDYYYMRIRYGISLYERRNYLAAIREFRKALEFNQGDPVALEYLYYCWLMSGREATARAVRGSFSEKLQEKTAASATRASWSVDYMYSQAASDNLVAEPESIYGYGLEGSLVIPRDFMNYSITASHNVSAHATIIQSATFLRKTNWLYHKEGVNAAVLREQKLNQVQYYFSPLFATSGGLTIRPYFHYLNVRYPMIFFYSHNMVTYASTYIEDDHNFVAGLSLDKNAGPVELRISAQYSYMNYRDHLQGGLELILFPAGNSSIYFGGGLYPLLTYSDTGWESRNIFSWVAGAGLGGKVWIELTGLAGEVTNFTGSNGYIVYNGMEPTKDPIHLNITIPFGDSGVIAYLSAAYTNLYPAYSPEPGSVITYKEEEIGSFKVLGGLSWRF